MKEPAGVLELLAWGEANGTSMPGVQMEGRTMHAKEDLAAGDTLMRLPLRLLMTVEAACRDPLLGPAFSKLREDGMPERSLLALFLATERAKGPSSSWGPYLAAMPPHFTTLLWLSARQVDMVRGTRVAASLPRERAALRLLGSESAPKLLAAAELCCREDSRAEALQVVQAASSASVLLWARTVLWSRAFTLRMAAGHVIAMVPIFDMGDHNPSSRVTWMTEEAEGWVRFITDAPLSSGDVIYNNYGQKPNEELFVSYGFALLPNLAERFHVRLGLSSGLADASPGQSADEGDTPGTAASRRVLLRQLGLSTAHELCLRAPLPPPLLAATRACLMAEQHAYALASAAWDSDSRTSSATPPDQDVLLEWRVLATLRSLLLHELSRYANGADLAADRKLLSECQLRQASGEVSPADRRTLEGDEMCIRYRIGQKEIAHAALAAIAAQASALLLLPTFALQAGLPGPKSHSRSEGQVSACEGEVRLQVVLAPIGSSSDSCFPALRVTQDCAAGDQLASIPLQQVLSVEGERGRASPVALALHKVPHLEESTQLQLLLMAESGIEAAGSTYTTLIQALSARPQASVCCGEAAVEALEGTGLGDVLGQQLEELHTQYGALVPPLQAAHPEVFSPEAFSWERFLWAHGVVQRHAVLVEAMGSTSYEGGEVAFQEHRPAGLALAPLLCRLPSHLVGVAVKAAVDASTGILRLQALCDLKAGIILQHAKQGLDSETIFLQVGLEAVEVGNGCDVVELQIGPSPEDPLAAMKERLLDASRVGRQHYLGLLPTPARVQAAVAICTLDSRAMEETGVSALLESVEAADSAARLEEEDWTAPVVGEVEGGQRREALQTAAQQAAAAAKNAASEYIDRLRSIQRPGIVKKVLRQLLQSARATMAGGSAEDDLHLYEAFGAHLSRPAGLAPLPSASSGPNAANRGIELEDVSSNGRPAGGNQLANNAAGNELGAVCPTRSISHTKEPPGLQREEARHRETGLRAALAYRHGQKRILDAWLATLARREGDASKKSRAESEKKQVKRRRATLNNYHDDLLSTIP